IFDIFTFPLVQGNSATALKEPFTAVVTQRSAKKLFANDNALGAIVRLNGHDYTITGVVKDVPEFSHLNFDILGSLSTREVTEKGNKGEMECDNICNTWISVRHT